MPSRQAPARRTSLMHAPANRTKAIVPVQNGGSARVLLRDSIVTQGDAIERSSPGRSSATSLLEVAGPSAVGGCSMPNQMRCMRQMRAFTPWLPVHKHTGQDACSWAVGEIASCGRALDNRAPSRRSGAGPCSPGWLIAARRSGSSAPLHARGRQAEPTLGRAEKRTSSSANGPGPSGGSNYGRTSLSAEPESAAQTGVVGICACGDGEGLADDGVQPFGESFRRSS